MEHIKEMQPFIKSGFGKNRRKKQLSFLLLICLFPLQLMAQIPLDWTFYSTFKPEVKYHLGERGSVQKALFDQGVLPDPFYGLNEEKYGWIEEKDWIFEAKFTLTESDLRKNSIILAFKNIDTYARIFVNNQKVGLTESAFISYRFDIKKEAKVGENIVHIHFVSPINYHKDAYQNLKVKFPTPNDANDSIQVVSMSRKPQYQFGWDWALRMNTIGLDEPAYVETYYGNKVLQTSVQTLSINPHKALMYLNVIFDQPIEANQVAIDSKIIRDAQILTKENIDKNVVQLVFKVENPQLYWPVGYGEPILYQAPLRVYANQREVYEDEHFYYGISKKELIQKPDDWGTSFEIHWNDSLIFCKGGDYIPQDVFLSEVTEERMKEVIDQCVEANFNMIRIWGGGYYLPDFFYQYCAQKGILIWQDFMFACSLYPGDKHFLELVKAEATYQIPRIATHPNIAYFNGNNEVMVAGKYWGFKEKYRIDSKTQQEFDENYDRLFKQLLPDEVKKWTTIPYEHTSPLSHWGKDEWYRHGTQHYWGVWHGSDPLEDMANKSGRFNAEYGFQSFPEYSTWLKVSEKEDWNLKSSVIEQHQKSYVGNGMILKQATKLFGKPRDFEDFVYLSQLTQAEAVGLAIASQRLQFPRVTGTIYWQINDCWPVSSWSSIDYYGNWKALHYRVKNDFEPVAVLRDWKKNRFEYFIYNEQKDPQEVHLAVHIYQFNGTIMYSDSMKFDIPPTKKIQIKNLPTGDFAVFEWNVNGKALRRSFLLDEKNYKRSDSLGIQVLRIEKVSGTEAILHFENKTFSAYTWFTTEQGGVHFEDNFEHFIPGTHQLKFSYQGELPKIDNFIIKSL